MQIYDSPSGEREFATPAGIAGGCSRVQLFYELEGLRQVISQLMCMPCHLATALGPHPLHDFEAAVCRARPISGRYTNGICKPLHMCGPQRAVAA